MHEDSVIEDTDHVIDPKENPTKDGHLPVSGEVGAGPVSYHDPLTQDTDDGPEKDEEE
jgi:hypothetical protein